MINRFLHVSLVLVFVIISVLTPFPFDKSAKASASSNIGLVTSQYANIYNGPGQRFGLTEAIVERGDLVTTYQTTNGWTYIESENTAGWIWGEFVEKSTGIGVITASHVNLYNGAALASGTNGSISRGTTVTLFGERNGWRNAYVDGKGVWIWGEFVDQIRGIGTISSSFSNLYNSPALSSGTKGRINTGTTIAYSELQNGWRKAYVNGEASWIWDENIRKSNIDQVRPGIITNPSQANIYNSAALAHGTKGNFKNGVRVSIITTLNGWTYVQGNNQEGWVWGTYVDHANITGKVSNTTFANIYNSAASSSGTKGRINAGTTITMYEEINGWRKIKAGDTQGWIWGEFVQPNRLVPPLSLGSAETKYGLNIYRGPGTTHATIGSIPKGSSVRIFHLENGWRYVHAGNIQGWVWDDYLVTELEKILSNITIILDPGHGGNDPGAVNRELGLRESDIVLDIGLRTNQLFESTPFNIKMTRSTDRNNLTANGSTITTTESLRLRTEFAKKNRTSNEDIFISLHNNAVDSPNAHGTETYRWNGSNEFTQDSQILAQRIHGNLISNMQMNDRGVKSANFYVLRENAMPSVLVEIGFITNPNDATKLSNPYWRQQAALGIYNGILDYYTDMGFDVSKYRK